MKEFVELTGIIIASVTAIWGINAWRREFVHKRKYELAEEALALFYEARDNIKAIRNPLSYSSEGSSRKQMPSESEEDTKILNRVYIVVERYDRNSEKFNRLFSLKYRFMTLFGKNAAAPIQELQAKVNKIFISAHMLSYYWKSENRLGLDTETRKHFNDEIGKHESVFWESYSKDDTLGQEIEQLVVSFENICSDILTVKPFEICTFIQDIRKRINI